jgi:hypothetical protein
MFVMQNMLSMKALFLSICVSTMMIGSCFVAESRAAEPTLVNDPVMQDVEKQILERQGETVELNFSNRVMQERVMQQNVEGNLMQGNVQPVMQKQMREQMQQEMEASGTVGQVSIDPKQMQLEMQQRMKKIMQERIQAGLFGTQPAVTEFSKRKDMASRAAASTANALIDKSFHRNANILRVPADYETIQSAIDAAVSGTVVLVSPGTYYEQLVMKDGVKLISDVSHQGEVLSLVRGAELRLPGRTLRTIIDGSKAQPSEHGMIDFDPGVGPTTIVDGFTIQNLPIQDHHNPGHAHGLNIRGASPVITNCLIRNMGSTGIGAHVVYHDQDSPGFKRDFRWNNIKHQASPVIFKNIIHGSLGLGIGCNHFSTPIILGNEVFGNDDSSLGDATVSPGIGNKHGSAATIIGNLVHDNPGGGILCKYGEPQGAHPIDRAAHPTFSKNIIYNNGTEKPAVSCQSCGTLEDPVSITENYLFNSSSIGIALGRGAVGIIEDNMLSNIAKPGISVFDAVAVKVNRNTMRKRGDAPGIIVKGSGRILEMEDNDIEVDDDYPEVVMKNQGSAMNTGQGMQKGPQSRGPGKGYGPPAGVKFSHK